MPNLKRKQLNVGELRLKFDDDARTFEGYASKFNGIDSYGDSIVPGAYAKTLEDRERPIRMRSNHWGPVIGKWLEIREDDEGLFVKGELTPGHRVAEDVYASLKHGAVDGLSIGYHVVDQEFRDGVNYLKQIDLVEISVVEEPADTQALVSGVKSEAIKQALESATSLKEMEGVLRDGVGLSRSIATALVSRVKAIVSGDREQKSDLSEIAEAIKGLKI